MIGEMLAGGAPVGEVLDAVDMAIEDARRNNDAPALARLADELDASAAGRGGEWRGLAIAAQRARMLAGEPVVPLSPAPPKIVYAGWWLRTSAFLLDVMLLSIAYGLLVQIAPGGSSGVAAVMLWFGPLVYFAWMHAAGEGATLGKRVLGVAVRDRDGDRAGFGACVVRALATAVLWATVIGGLIDAILLAADRRKQSVHDKIAGTFVVRTR